MYRMGRIILDIGANAHGGESHSRMMKHAKSGIKARPLPSSTLAGEATQWLASLRYRQASLPAYFTLKLDAKIQRVEALRTTAAVRGMELLAAPDAGPRKAQAIDAETETTGKIPDMRPPVRTEGPSRKTGPSRKML